MTADYTNYPRSAVLVRVQHICLPWAGGREDKAGASHAAARLFEWCLAVARGMAAVGVDRRHCGGVEAYLRENELPLRLGKNSAGRAIRLREVGTLVKSRTEQRDRLIRKRGNETGGPTQESGRRVPTDTRFRRRQ